MTFNYSYYNSYSGSDTAAMQDSSMGIKKVLHGFPKVDFLITKKGTSIGSTGISVNKDMSRQTSSFAIPSGAEPTGSGLTPTGSRWEWSDWSSDVFDGWGRQYIYNPSTNLAEWVPLNQPMNSSDGVVYEETANLLSKSWRIRHGWVGQGIFRLDISCTSDPSFVFTIGHYGNMGSDGSQAVNRYTTNFSWGDLFWISNQQYGSSSEVFSLYGVCRNKEQNTGTWNSSRFYHGISGSDNLYHYLKDITHGATFYYAKSLNVASIVGSDIEISGNYLA